MPPVKAPKEAKPKKEAKVPKPKKESKPKKVPVPVYVADIDSFFVANTRNENDAANKVRERVLGVINNPPADFLSDSVYGSKWETLKTEWDKALREAAVYAKLGAFDGYTVKMKGGRGATYDALVGYKLHGGGTVDLKIEFKNGGTNIGELAQFLSLPVKTKLFENEDYSVFYYKNYIDKYIACDAGITQPKPDYATYMKFVIRVNYECHPYFAQIKEREDVFKAEKNKVVNDSITDYLTKYGKNIDLAALSDKVKATQEGKIYLLWSGGKFHIDSLKTDELAATEVLDVVNGNVLPVKAGRAIYGMLLRWRNHKGVLNPAWQISMKRT